MPDPVTVLTAVAAAATVATGVYLVCLVPGARVACAFRECGQAIGIGSGSVAGMAMLGVFPSGHFSGDQERLAFIVLPLITVTEMVIAFAHFSGWPATLTRALVAVGVCPILLYGSVYLPGSSEAGLRGIRPAETAAMLGGVGLALSSGLLVMAGFRHRPRPPCLPLVLGLTIAAAGVTTLLSGYLTGGLAALPIGAAVLAVHGASRLQAEHSSDASGLSVGLVGLASILIIGHWFGSLTSPHAVFLAAASFVPVLADMTGLRRLPEWQRGMISVGLTVTVLTCVVAHAQTRFQAAYAPSHKAGPASPALEDYLKFSP